MTLRFTLLIIMFRDLSCMIRKVILLITLSYSVLTRYNTSMFYTLHPLEIPEIFLLNSITRFHYIKIVLYQKYHNIHYLLGSNMLKQINCMKTLCDQLNQMGDTVTDKELACNLLASLPLDKYEAFNTSLDVQGEDNLQVDRLKGLILLSFDCEVFYDSTRKDSEANFSKSNMSGYNHWVPKKRINGLYHI